MKDLDLSLLRDEPEGEEQTEQAEAPMRQGVPQEPPEFVRGNEIVRKRDLLAKLDAELKEKQAKLAQAGSSESKSETNTNRSQPRTILRANGG